MNSSYLSKNIRKLRAFKSLNQTQFAEIFDIKRSSIGAYEEGRAEPKLETIIKIAKHFNLQIDDLIIKELTVNQIANFDKTYDKMYNKQDNTPLLKEIDKLHKRVEGLELKIDTLINKIK
jgi:DNA-binding XRE family transcriptional regulator